MIPKWGGSITPHFGHTHTGSVERGTFRYPFFELVDP